MEGPVIWLGDGYEARPLTLEAYRDACARLEGRIFGGNWGYAFDRPVKSPLPLGETFQWGLYHGDDLIGWHHAHQQGERTVYMADTGILPEHQGRGLYSRLLPHVVEVYRQAGYTLVQSHHRATNNRVIIPKLRAGFFLQGLNLYEGGLNVALTLSLDDTYREAMHVRSGFRQAVGETARRLGLNLGPGEEREKAAPCVPMPELPDTEAFDLGGGYTAHPVPYKVYWATYKQLEDVAYQSVSFDWQGAPTASGPTAPSWAWLIAREGEVVGWSAARAWNERTVYMSNTAFLPQHRGKGLYTRLLPHLLDTFQREGYPLVRSHHHVTNNAVIVPKLRAGFRIQGLQTDEHGVMAVLIHAFDPVYRDYMDARSGLTRPRGEVARRLGLHLREDEA
ncbi:GNAT family N-acetyltransferase [Deinococcus metallilatus]|uniref:GNAT family N-acetyltransferase n=1 Tax=Deinococcus metallilatus TaxID=1211322 RepID=A0AAJ5JYW7_9DEIO|nr:GNAT family N-acetyltransferase [Deinococcus metallilatus]MBB5294571.1 ribosomal protein S18 acetylase RimI-like enzyme [Deinococcus metallilatus]QBY07614.1 GNAT family N-acetyltransferase [Deinococcus metallilatus]RXJ14030.1 GNAT family N-acetyltransferase [Deinococcus metallilatus]TLK29995.1 GNAT family N-acetyltransferase [Deinococcus metallilatus]GMA15784.1 acetyltransferase [Deinococcus metallilatus]